MRMLLANRFAQIFVLFVLVFGGIMFLRTSHTYINTQFQFELTYPPGWSVKEFLVGNEPNFEFDSDSGRILGSFQYGTISDIFEAYTHCAGDCPHPPPVVEHITVGGVDALRVTMQDKQYPALQYFIPVPTTKVPIAILWLIAPTNGSEFNVLESIVQSFKRI